MKIRVKFFATFRELFGGEEKEIELENGSNIQDLLNRLCDLSRCHQKIFDDSGKLRPDVKILKKRRHVQFLDGLDTQLEEGDVLIMFPVASGG